MRLGHELRGWEILNTVQSLLSVRLTAELNETVQNMSGDSAFSIFARSVKDRLTEPRVVGPQLAVIFVLILVFRGDGFVSADNPVLALGVVPVLTYLTLFLPVGVIQDGTLRIEEGTNGDDEVCSRWQSIATRLIVWLNAAVVVPMLIWGLPVTGTLGYTAEAAAELALGESVSADHSLTGTILIGLVLVGGAWATLGVFTSFQAYIGPNLSKNRIQTYLGLRESLPSRGTDSLAPTTDGRHTRIDTATLADACVKYTLTRAVQEGLPDRLDIERIVEHTTPKPASSRALFVFFITLNRRFLSVLLGSMTFVIAATFGLDLGSISAFTLLVGAILGPATQLGYKHPFVSAEMGVLT